MRYSANPDSNFRRRSGFTLIELLIVVVIIGILAAIAVPKFRNTKSKAFLAAMKSDLRNLATAQEAHYYDNGVYTTDVVALRFTPSAGVTVTVTEATAAGWSATSSHSQAWPLTCALFMGNAAPVAPATREGQLGCA